MRIKNILIISNEPWGNIWFSKHHYAHELSKKYTVYFVNPTSGWVPSNLVKSKIVINKVSHQLFTVDYYNFLPSFFMEINNNVVSNRIYKFLFSKGIKIDIFWTFDPIRLFRPNLFHVNKSIFHIVDKYQWIHKAEPILHRNVDFFICVSTDFVQQYNKYQKPTRVIPHGVSKDEFLLGKIDFKPPFVNYVLYVGTIDIRLDYGWLVRMLEMFKYIKFVFIGGLKAINDENYRRIFIHKEFDNLYYLPPVHAKELKYYIHYADFCLAPMLKSYEGNLISHHKIFQYLAHGKPIFSPVFSEYLSFKTLLYMDNEESTLLEKMDELIKNGEDENLKNERISFAIKNQYDNHLNEIMKFIGE